MFTENYNLLVRVVESLAESLVANIIIEAIEESVKTLEEMQADKEFEAGTSNDVIVPLVFTKEELTQFVRCLIADVPVEKLEFTFGRSVEATGIFGLKLPEKEKRAGSESSYEFVEEAETLKLKARSPIPTILVDEVDSLPGSFEEIEVEEKPIREPIVEKVETRVEQEEPETQVKKNDAFIYGNYLVNGSLI